MLRKHPKCSWILTYSLFIWQMSEIWWLFWRFLCLGWSDWFLVFCIFSGSSRHKFRVPSRHTLKIFFCFIFKIERKKCNFGNSSSVNFEFLFFSGVHIASCKQLSGLALFKCWKKCISLRLTMHPCFWLKGWEPISKQTKSLYSKLLTLITLIGRLQSLSSLWKSSSEKSCSK